MKRENIGWVDVLRIVAIFMMIVSHCCDGFVSQFDTNRANFLTGALTGSAMRACVPLFAMLTGVLLLPVLTDMKSFYKKRIGRILIPLIFWSVVSPLLFYAYFNFINPATANPSVDLAGHTLKAEGLKIVTFIFNFNYDTTPLWYLYMLIGLYLIMPLVSPWIQKATQSELKLFLMIWGITLIIPYVEMVAPFLGYTGNYGSMGILGESFWNKYGTFYYMSGFLGYLILGYYLVKYPLNWTLNKTLGIAVPIFVVGYLITSFGFVLTQKYFPGQYMYLEIVWYFTGINVAMMTVAMFVIVQKLNIHSYPLLSTIASYAFGIYLCHFLCAQIAYDLFDVEALPAFIRILSMAIFTFTVSNGVVWILKKAGLRKLVS